MTGNKTLSGSIGVLAAAALWGTTGTAATFAPEVSPLAIGALAMGLGGIMQALIATRLITSSRAKIARQWRLMLLGSVAIGIYPLAFYSSMKLAGVAVGTVISIGFAPLISALLERVFDKKRLTSQWKTGAAFGITGATMLCLSKSHLQNTGSIEINNYIYGILMGLVAALTYAAYSHIAHRLMQQGIGSRAAMGSLFGIGGLLLLPVLYFTGSAFLHSWSNIAVGIYMASVPMFLGYILFGFGLARISASTATTLSLFEPAVATILAVIIVGEHLTIAAWSGIALIVTCLFILTCPGLTAGSATLQPTGSLSRRKWL